MEDVLLHLVNQAPEAVAILVVVVIFLKTIAKRDKSYEDQQTRWFEAWRAVAQDNARIIEKNSEVLGSVRDHLASSKKGAA